MIKPGGEKKKHHPVLAVTKGNKLIDLRGVKYKDVMMNIAKDATIRSKKSPSDILEDHLIKHQEVYDPMIRNHEDILFGPKKDNGMCADVREIKQGYATMKTIGVGILISLLINIILMLVK